MLGIAVANLAHLLNPDTVVFAGGLSGAGDLLFVPLRAEFRRRAFPRAYGALRIVMAELGDDAGLVGAARAFALSREDAAW
jgi:glucokinase